MNLDRSDSIILVLPSTHMDQVPTLWLLEHLLVSFTVVGHLHLNKSVFLSESAFGLLRSCLMRT